MKERSGKAPQVGSKRRRFDGEKEGKRGYTTEIVDAKKLERLRELYRTRFHAVYANIGVAKAKMSADGSRMFVQLHGEGESYCLNKGDNHASNRVYGIVDRTKAWLRCHSSKQVKRSNTGLTCDKFAVGKFLSDSDKTLLFGDVPSRGKSKSSCLFKLSPDEYLERMSDEIFGKSG